MKRFVFALAPMALMVSCSPEELNLVANIGCSELVPFAAQYANSTKESVKLSVHAINGLCADPNATISEANAARVALKNAVAKQ